MRGAEVLSQADVVLHDALVSEEVLELCPPHCELVAVGKRRGIPFEDRQAQIHQLLEDASLKHKVIVRLKGGDPCIFGRGGEDIEFLESKGIPWEMIPGVSAGIGGLSALGLPVTHRDVASSVTILTGSHALSGDTQGIEWAKLIHEKQTLVFYMPFQHIEKIVTELTEHGMSAETWSAVISKISLPDQKVITAPLSEIVDAVSKAKMETPALMVVGQVVKCWNF